MSLGVEKGTPRVSEYDRRMMRRAITTWIRIAVSSADVNAVNSCSRYGVPPMSTTAIPQKFF